MVKPSSFYRTIIDNIVQQFVLSRLEDSGVHWNFISKIKAIYSRNTCVEVHDDLFLPNQIPSYVFFKDCANFLSLTIY